RWHALRCTAPAHALRRVVREARRAADQQQAGEERRESRSHGAWLRDVLAAGPIVGGSLRPVGATAVPAEGSGSASSRRMRAFRVARAPSGPHPSYAGIVAGMRCADYFGPMLTLASNPALTVGIALAAGVIAQVVARHVQMPSIVLLLIAGVLLGPDVAGLVQPAELGEAIHMLV